MSENIYAVDASALVKAAIPEEYSDVMRRIVGMHEAGAIRLIAPDFIFTECANVLWKHIRRGDLSVAEAEFSLAELRSRNIPLVPQGALLDDALRFASAYGSSVYDALYCALAQRENADLITADARLVNRVAGSGVGALTLPAWAERAGWQP